VSALVPLSREIEAGIDEAEAFANGELDFDTEDTTQFFARPRVGTRLKTPNGSTIKVTRILHPQATECELWVMAVGMVKKAPQCPQYVETEVTFLVNQDGAVCFFDEH
jgi:hypothetical protein